MLDIVHQSYLSLIPNGEVKIGVNMKAIVWNKYGAAKHLKLEEIDKPIPKDDEILIKIHASTVTAGDCEIRTLKLSPFIKVALRIYFGIIKPKNIILGQELSGEVEAVGSNVTRFKIGDHVLGSTGFKFGGYAEYVCLKATSDMSAMTIKPDNISFEAASALTVGGLEAVYFMNRIQLRENQSILINGAAGSIGTIAVQLAKHYGAKVTAVDSTEKLDVLKSVGADHVIDYTKEDFTTAGVKYDVIFDVVGKTHFKRTLKTLNKDGIYALGNPTFLKSIRSKFASGNGKKKVFTGTSDHNLSDLEYLIELVSNATIETVIDQTFPLEKTPEAHQYVEDGHKKGNVIIKVI